MRTLTLLLASVLAAGCRGPASPRAENALYPGAPVIVISIDTLRADRLPVYGYDGVATPAIDRFREEAMLFRNAYTHSPLTLPSHVSILTGLLPHEHGVRNNIGYRFDAGRRPSLPTLLRQAGYVSGAAVSSFVLRGQTGLNEIFDFYDDEMPAPSGSALGRVQRAGQETAAVAASWMARQESRPFFFLLHLFEPHAPYDPPEPFRSRYPDRYDGEIAAADQIIGEFLDRLRETGVYDRAVIVLLSDHGEGLNDHGEPQHGVFLYREAIQVPLLLKLPGSSDQGRTEERPVGLIDVAPTILALTGTNVPPGMAGRSLLDDSASARAIFAETMYPRIHFGWSELRSLVDSTHHYIDAPRPELYDLRADPREKRNVAAEDRRRTSAMRAALEPFRRELMPAEAIDPEEAAKLAALGYLGSTTTARAGPLPDPKERIATLSLLSEAQTLLDRGENDRAVAALQKIVDENPLLTDAWNTLGDACLRSGRLERGVEAYRRAIALAPDLAPQVALSIASAELKLNHLQSAARHADLALRSNPPAASLILGRIAFAEGDLAEAERRAAAARSDGTYARRAGVLLAQVRLAERKPEEALRIAQSVAGAGPVELLEFVRGDALARLGRLSEAEQAFRREIDLYPQDREAYARLAALLILQRRTGEAERVMEALVRVNPDRSSYRLAAQTFRDFGHSESAARWERRASP